MKKLNFKARLIFILAFSILLPIIATLSYFSVHQYLNDSLDLYFKVGLFLVFGFSLTLILVEYRYVQSTINRLLDEIRKGVIALQKSDYNYKIDLPEDKSFSKIIDEFNKISQSLKKNNEKIKTQAIELKNKTNEIDLARMELAASYSYLQEKISQLSETEENYSTLVENLDDIVCFISLDGTVFCINEAVRRTLGYTKEEIEGKSFKDLVKPDVSDKLFEKISKELKIKNTMELDLDLVAKDGRNVTTQVTLTNFNSNGSARGIQAILKDITQEREIEQEVIASYKELATINSISAKLNAILEIDNLLNLVTREVSEIFKSSFCTLRMLDETGYYLVPRAFAAKHIDVEAKDVSDFSIFSIQDPLCQKIFDAKEPIIRRNVTDKKIIEKDKEGNKNEHANIVEIMFVPLVVSEKKLGMITVGSATRFSARQKNLLSSIANNAAIAIENAQLYEISKIHFVDTVNALIAAIEAKDKYTQGHSYRVSKYAVIIAENLGLSKEEVDEIRIAGILHDVGKIGVPDAILSKPSKLSEEEYEQIKVHPSISNRILRSVGLSEKTLAAITYHHERWDGKGYPNGLSGEELSLEAQIISVADALDAMTSTRAYRRAMTDKEALNEILKGRERQFSPLVVDTLHKIFETKGDETFLDDVETVG
jgi:PAS domain S-box-containing protein